MMKHHTQQSIDDSIDRSAQSQQSQRKRWSYIDFATLQFRLIIVAFSSDMMCFGRFTTSPKNHDNQLDELSFEIPVGWSFFCMDKDAKAEVIWSGTPQEGVLRHDWSVRGWLLSWQKLVRHYNHPVACWFLRPADPWLLRSCLDGDRCQRWRH